MGLNEELDEQASDRLLTGDLAPDEVGAGYRQVAKLLAAARAEPSAAELARRTDTVRAMAAARRGGGQALDSSGASQIVPLARRRSVRMGLLAVAATVSLGSGLAAAGLLSGPLQSIVSGGLPTWGDSPSDPGGNQGPLGPLETTSPQSGPGAAPAAGGEASQAGSERPPQAAGGGPQQNPKTAAPGQAKQATKAVLGADATTSGGRLVVSFQETGVEADGVAVTARADATATYGCVRQNGKDARIRKEERVIDVSEAGNRFTAVSGTVGGALTLSAPSPAGVSCPAGEAPQLLRVLYSGVVVLDTTTGATASINRTFQATP